MRWRFVARVSAQRAHTRRTRRAISDSSRGAPRCGAQGGARRGAGGLASAPLPPNQALGAGGRAKARACGVRRLEPAASPRPQPAASGARSRRPSQGPGPPRQALAALAGLAAGVDGAGALVVLVVLGDVDGVVEDEVVDGVDGTVPFEDERASLR